MFKDSELNEDKKMTFQSERCYVRPFVDDELGDFLLYRNNPEWMKFQGFKGLSREEYAESLLRIPSFENGAQLAIISKSEEFLIGDVFIKKEEGTYWIGYTVNPLFKRQGYAYEVVNSMIAWIKQQGEYKIKAGVSPENIPSVRLLEKLVFSLQYEEEGELIYSL
ncbi:GNAT family N-acetyltransferase [Halobacillus faecis]